MTKNKFQAMSFWQKQINLQMQQYCRYIHIVAQKDVSVQCFDCIPLKIIEVIYDILIKSNEITILFITVL